MNTDLLFFATAALGGVINAVAGGGSFLLFPVLMFGGMGPVAANVMCTVAMLPGSLASSYAYWREIRTPIALLKRLLLICAIGSVLGTAILLYFPEEVFEALVPWLLLAATLIFTFGRKMIARLRFEHVNVNHHCIYIGILMIAIYGGYFGAGMGILLLAMLQLSGYSHMHEMNAIKAVLGSAISIAGAVVFVSSGSVVWDVVPILVAGGIMGGYLGTGFALRMHPEKVRKIVVVIAWMMTVYFFFREM